MNRGSRVVIGASTVAAVLLSGAVLAAAAPSESPLAGTDWRLVEFQSMDDAVGTVRRDDPSLYTSNAFALAAVAECHYGWKAGVPACALASVLAVSRRQRNKHNLSDVVAGAAVGYIVGRTEVRVNGGRPGPGGGATLSVTPLVGRRTPGPRGRRRILRTRSR